MPAMAIAALLQFDMADEVLAHRAFFECDHDRLEIEPPAPASFGDIALSLAAQRTCTCTYRTLYLWRSPAECRRALTVWAGPEPTFASLSDAIDRDLRLCSCHPRVGVVIAEGGVAVPMIRHEEGCAAERPH